MLAFRMRCLLAVVAAVTLFAQDVGVDSSVWATALYLGGSRDDTPRRAKVDASGNAYIVGSSSSPDLTGRVGEFLMKVAPSGAIVYAMSLFHSQSPPYLLE